MLLVEETEMGVATTLEEYLVSRAIAFDVIEHPHTNSAMRAAEAAHVPGDQVAKPVLLGDEHSYLLAVIPATHRLELDRLNQMLARSLEMLPEEEVEATLEALPEGVAQIGFYSYGELSPHKGASCDLHNQTMTITTIRELD